MTAAAPRTTNGTRDLRRIGVALGVMALAVALLVGVAAVRRAGGPSTTATGQGRDLVVTSTDRGAIQFTGIPYQAVRRSLVVTSTDRGAIQFTGIPYQAVRRSLVYRSGRPAPKPLPSFHGNPSRMRTAQ